MMHPKLLWCALLSRNVESLLGTSQLKALPRWSRTITSLARKSGTTELVETMQTAPLKRKTLVIVESPAKAKTIQKFFPTRPETGEVLVDFCLGHIRDLMKQRDIPKELKKENPDCKMGIDVLNNFAPMYCEIDAKADVVKRLRKELVGCSELILATDEDREGEAISWHLLEVLKPKPSVVVKRAVFHEITKRAVEEAFANPRSIDMNLVAAQETRRVLDRLAGFTVSPLLWKKVAPKLSAGRVQSVGMAMVVNRERKRLAHVASSYASLTARLQPVDETEQQTQELSSQSQIGFEVKLHSVSGVRVALGKDFDSKGALLVSPNKGGDGLLHLKDAAEARELCETILKGGVYETRSKQDEKQEEKQEESGGVGKVQGGVRWVVGKVEGRQRKASGPSAFTTSSLQQEANKKLKFGAAETMRAAQRLYEAGFITYMRTDSSTLSSAATFSAVRTVASLYGEDFVKNQPTQQTQTQQQQEGDENDANAAPATPEKKSQKKKQEVEKQQLFAQEAHEAIRPVIRDDDDDDDDGVADTDAEEERGGIANPSSPSPPAAPVAASGAFPSPAEVAKHFGAGNTACANLYGLIWRRTLASVMADSVTNTTSVEVHVVAPSSSSSSSSPTLPLPPTSTSTSPPLATFRASGRTVVFPGFRRALDEFAGGGGDGGDGDGGGDEVDADGEASAKKESTLPVLKVGQELALLPPPPSQTAAVSSPLAAGKDSPGGDESDVLEASTRGPTALAVTSHRTSPPARYTVASFIKELETQGVGRPSTYATIVENLQSRGYVSLLTSSGSSSAASSPSAPKKPFGSGFKKASGGGAGSMAPSLAGFVVTDLLQTHCPLFVQANFTASMESHLDRIAQGSAKGPEYLAQYYLDPTKGLKALAEKMATDVDPVEARRVRGLVDNFAATAVADVDNVGTAATPSAAAAAAADSADSAEPKLFFGPYGAWVERPRKWWPPLPPPSKESLPLVEELGGEEDKSGGGVRGSGGGDTDVDTEAGAQEGLESVELVKCAVPADLCLDVWLLSKRPQVLESLLMVKERQGLVLGEHPESGLPVALKVGPYGFYVQHGRDEPSSEEEGGGGGGQSKSGEKKAAEKGKKGKKTAVKGKKKPTTAAAAKASSKSSSSSVLKRVSATYSSVFARLLSVGEGEADHNAGDDGGDSDNELALRRVLGHVMTLEDALVLLALPREVCVWPVPPEQPDLDTQPGNEAGGGGGGEVEEKDKGEGGEEGKVGEEAAVGESQSHPVVVGIGRYGPYLRYHSYANPTAPAVKYAKLLPQDDPLTVTAERALEIISASEAAGPKKGSGILHSYGEVEGHNLEVRKGRFGSYVKWGTLNQAIPSELEENLEDLPLEVAFGLLQKKRQEQPESKDSGGSSSSKAKAAAGTVAVAGEKKSIASASASASAKLKSVKKKAATKKTATATKKKKKTSTATAVPRGKSAWLYFCDDKRPQLAGKTLGEMSKEMSAQWRVLDETGRAPYAALAAKDKSEKVAASAVALPN